MYNILFTGNPNKRGIPGSIKQHFPNTVFAHQSGGWDLTDYEQFKSKITEYNVFVNFSNFNNTIQLDLLNLTVDTWKKNNIQGHIFTFGSIIEYEFLKNVDIDYHNKKTNLKNTSIDLCSEKIKTTYIIIGGIQNEDSFHESKLDCRYIIDIIKYALEFKHHIPIIAVEAIVDEFDEYRRCLK